MSVRKGFNLEFLFCINLKVKSKPVTTSSASSKTITKTTTTKTKVREKKVYSLPGQKHDPPEQVLNLSHLVHGIHKPMSTYGNRLVLILEIFFMLSLTERTPEDFL